MHSEIITGLFCGDASAALAPENEKFDCILNIAREVPFSSCLADSVETHKYDIIDDDMQDEDMQLKMLHSFPEACNIIKNSLESNRLVLVHCLEGMQRSCSIIMAYLLHSMSYHQAFCHITTKHEVAFDRGSFVHFENALRAWEAMISASTQKS